MWNINNSNLFSLFSPPLLYLTRVKAAKSGSFYLLMMLLLACRLGSESVSLLPKINYLILLNQTLHFVCFRPKRSKKYICQITVGLRRKNKDFENYSKSKFLIFSISAELPQLSSYKLFSTNL